MPKKYRTILLVTNGFDSAHVAEETALNLAREHQANVKIVDTVRPPSFASKWLTSNAEDLFGIVVNDKKTRLKKVASVFEEAGISVEMDVLFGSSAAEIVRDAIKVDADLVIRYQKGDHSQTTGRFGTTALNLMRICPCPLLLVGDQPIATPHVLACVNVEHSDSENEAILEEARRLAGEAQQLDGLFCWNFNGAKALSEYANEETMQGYWNEAQQYYEAAHQKFVDQHELSAFAQGVQMKKGNPVQVIPDTCKHDAVDVVVMSSASQNHPLHRLLGSTVESLLNEIPCALMVVKTQRFDSPIKPN